MNKKILLLLLLTFFTIIRLEDVNASSFGGGGSSFKYECARCGGDWQTYFRDEINDPYVFYVLGHNKNPDGTWTCDNMNYNRLQEHEVGGYYIRYNVLNSNGEYDMQYGFIFISEDTNFDTTTFGGEVVVKRYSEYTSSNYAGESNDRFYIGWIHSGLYYPFELNNGDFDFVVTVEDRQYLNQQFHELARYLCGETTELPSGVTVERPPEIYDLEPPLNVKVNSSSATKNVELYGFGLNNKIQGNAIIIPYKVWWDQSSIDLSGYQTEFYVREYGKYKPSLMKGWQEISTLWQYDNTLVTAKYCNNSLKFYEFNVRKEQRLYQYIEELNGEKPYNVEFYYPDFMLRNSKEDENGQKHYSNWVYVKIYEDGTYSTFEMKNDYDITEDSDETGNIDKDSDIYDDEIIHTDTQQNQINVGGVSNSGSFITVMKDLANSIKTFPDFFSQIFSFLPAWILTCIGTLFIIILICAIF